jgi:hypothetical protein
MNSLHQFSFKYHVGNEILRETVRHLFTLAILIFICTPPASAQTSIPVRQGNFIVRLYMDTCVKYPGKNSDISSYAKDNKFVRANAEFSKAVLKGKEGEVWGIPNAIGQFIIVLTGESHCAAWARNADVKTVNDGFEKFMKHLHDQGLNVKPQADQILSGAGGKYRQLGYFVQKHGTPYGLLMLSTTTDSSTAEIQVRLTSAVSTP